VILRLDSQGSNPFHALYHEYMHATLHLNFTGLPVWLDEGLSEFYGNSQLGEKESRVGTIDEAHLYILGQNKLLPIETLLTVEQNSPYYNEAEQASVFYAESWALVHYLMLDPEAQRRELLKTFLAAWTKGATQIEAARQAFGDLRQFGKVIEAYSRQNAFRVALYKSGQQAAEKSYTVRSLSAAEVLALRGDAAAHRKMLEQARPLVEQAVQTDPNLAIGHEAKGYYLYRKEDLSGADTEMKKAMELGSTTFVAPYYHGMLLLQKGGVSPEVAQEAIKSLEKATQLNPQFAPAFEGMAQAYSANPETLKQALEAGIHAVKLEPAAHGYAMNLIYLLLNANRDTDARQMAQQLAEKASSPEEAQAARELLVRIQEHEKWVAQMKQQAEAAANQAASTPATASTTTRMIAPAVEAETKPGRTAAPIDPSTLLAVEGLVRKIDCSHKPGITVTLSGANRPLIFHAADLETVGVTGEGATSGDACETWKGRKIRLWFRMVKGKDYLGEITDIALQ
jgi:tetratricopeptide (TPR) repeat protein